MRKSRKALGVKRGSNYHEERAARTTFSWQQYVYMLLTSGTEALCIGRVYIEKSGDRLRTVVYTCSTKGNFEHLIANNTRIVHLRMKCNTIIPHVILQMAGGYKF